MDAQTKRRHQAVGHDLSGRRRARVAAAVATLALAALPAAAQTFHVASGSVDGLAAAILAANASPGCDVRIELPAGTWTIGAPWTGADAFALTGLPEVRLSTPACDGETGGTRRLTIEGAGAELTVIQRAADVAHFRLLAVSPGGFQEPGGLVLRNLSLKGGRVSPLSSAEPGGDGGAVFVDSSALILDGVAMVNNQARQGGAIFVETGRLHVRRSHIESNTAARQGGAIFGSGEIVIADSSVSGNASGGQPVPVASSSGGAISWRVDNPNSSIVASTLADNVMFSNVGDGGALDLRAEGGPPFGIFRSELRGNRATGRGGAIASALPVLLESSTVSGNGATLGGGALSGSLFMLANATVAMNEAPAGGAAIAAGELRARNSIVAATQGAGAVNCSADTVTTSEGFNLDSDGSCRFAGVGDAAGFDPASVIDLVPRNHGGTTLTHAPVPGGLAIDRVTAGACHLELDQRGAFGLQDGDSDGAARCDVGAVEHEPALLVLAATADSAVRTDLDLRRNDNYGLQDTLRVGTGRGGDGKPFGAPDQMRALLRFDLSFLAGLALRGAALELRVQGFEEVAITGVMPMKPRAHAIVLPGGAPQWVEGNGFEGARPVNAPAALTDPDRAFGVAWAGAGENPDPAAANNTTQPPFDPQPLSAQLFARERSWFAAAEIGSTLRWNVTAAAQRWIDGSLFNAGVMLVDPTTDGGFRGVRFGSRDGEAYRLPGAVAGPRLALSWTPGTLAGDITGDACVDRRDLDLLMGVVRGRAVAGAALRPRLDLNVDGRIDVADARRLATLFTRPLGAPCP